MSATPLTTQHYNNKATFIMLICEIALLFWLYRIVIVVISLKLWIGHRMLKAAGRSIFDYVVYMTM